MIKLYFSFEFQAFLKDFAKALDDEFAKDQVDNLALYADAYYEQRVACDKLKQQKY